MFIGRGTSFRGDQNAGRASETSCGACSRFEDRRTQRRCGWSALDGRIARILSGGLMHLGLEPDELHALLAACGVAVAAIQGPAQVRKQHEYQHELVDHLDGFLEVS